MPLYEYRCREDHITEKLAGFDVSEIGCPACGLPAQRAVVNLMRHTGFVQTPTAQRYVNLNRAVEAQHEMVATAEKHGIEAPDCYQIALDRVRRGDVKAIT